MCSKSPNKKSPSRNQRFQDSFWWWALRFRPNYLQQSLSWRAINWHPSQKPWLDHIPYNHWRHQSVVVIASCFGQPFESWVFTPILKPQSYWQFQKYFEQNFPWYSSRKHVPEKIRQVAATRDELFLPSTYSIPSSLGSTRGRTIPRFWHRSPSWSPTCVTHVRCEFFVASESNLGETA